MHADGDRAVHEGLDGIQALRERFPARTSARPSRTMKSSIRRISARYRQLNAIPVLSFQWEKPAPDTIEGARDYMGPARFKYMEPAGFPGGGGCAHRVRQRLAGGSAR